MSWEVCEQRCEQKLAKLLAGTLLHHSTPSQRSATLKMQPRAILQRWIQIKNQSKSKIKNQSKSKMKNAAACNIATMPTDESKSIQTKPDELTFNAKHFEKNPQLIQNAWSADVKNVPPMKLKLKHKSCENTIDWDRMEHKCRQTTNIVSFKLLSKKVWRFAHLLTPRFQGLPKCQLTLISK